MVESYFHLNLFDIKYRISKILCSDFQELKAFAIELQSNSNGAYELVRKTFGNALPHLATIRKWLAANLELSSKAILNALDAELPHDQMSSLGNTNQ